VATGRKWDSHENGSDKAKTVAVGCDPLLRGPHGKEEVDLSHRASVAVDPFTTADVVNPDSRALRVTGDDNLAGSLSHSRQNKRPAKRLVLTEHFTNVDLWWTPEPFIKAPAQAKKSLQTERADARTRTGDPFITSYGRVSLRVTLSHLQRCVEPNLPDWT
jgi:hypothetical protein